MNVTRYHLRYRGNYCYTGLDLSKRAIYVVHSCKTQDRTNEVRYKVTADIQRYRDEYSQWDKSSFPSTSIY